MQCNTCEKDLRGEFAFCRLCGNLICPACEGKYVQEQLTQTTKTFKLKASLKPITGDSVNLLLPKCGECQEKIMSMESQTRFKFFLLPMLVVMLSLGMLGTIYYGIMTGPNYNCLVGLWIGGIVLGLLFGGFVQTTVQKRRFKENEYLFNKEITCPVCGRQSEDSFWDTVIYLRNSEQKALHSKIRDLVHGERLYPDYLMCPGCGYNGSFTRGMGLRQFLRRTNWDTKMLKGTEWEVHTPIMERNNPAGPKNVR